MITMIKPKILVVDNDKDMCWLIAAILREEDFCIDIAHDVQSVLAKINLHQYEVMILDYKLSGMSGLTILEKTQQIKPPTVTIMISAFGNELVRAKAIEFKAYAFLDKPFNINDLKGIVKKALIEQKRRCINEMNLRKLPALPAGRQPGFYADERIDSSDFCGRIFKYGLKE